MLWFPGSPFDRFPGLTNDSEVELLAQIRFQASHR
jgi:hypothetical protein